MKNILRIDASARTEHSHSRALGDWLLKQVDACCPDHQVDYLDLATNALPHIHQMTINGYYTPEADHTPEMKEATLLSDGLIGQLQQADVLVMTLPMYNFSVPSSLKAWIDQIVRIGKTFSYENGAFGGLVTVKKAYVIVAYGAAGYVNGGGFQGANFVEPYLQFLLQFLGIQDVHFVSVESTTADESVVEQALEAARGDITRLINTTINEG